MLDRVLTCFHNVICYFANVLCKAGQEIINFVLCTSLQAVDSKLWVLGICKVVGVVVRNVILNFQF